MQATMQWSGWLEFKKQAGEERIIEGFASTEQPDTQGGIFQGQRYAGDLIDARAVKAALPDYMEWANLREMHQTSAVGVVLKAEVLDGDVEVDGRVYKSPLHIIARVIDDAAWEKVKSGVYKGFSIGGNVVKALLEKLNGINVRRIVAMTLHEISLVDRPANAGARLLLWKSAGLAGNTQSTEIRMSEPIKKATADPAKTMTGMQALRDQAELDGDLEGAALYTQAIALILQAAGEAEPPAETKEAPKETTEEAPAEGDSVPETGPEAGDSETEMPEEEPMMMAAGAKPDPAPIRKAGRKISGSNMQAMHAVIQALAKMMEGAGDTTAAAVLKCYGGQREEKVSKVEIGAEALQKALQEALGGADVLTKVAGDLAKVDQALTGLAERVDKLERQPAPGGPKLQAVQKTLATDPADPAKEPEKTPELSIADLRKAAAIEPDPIKKAALNQQLWVREHAGARF